MTKQECHSSFLDFACELLLTPPDNLDIYGTLFSLSLTILSDGVRLRLPVPAELGRGGEVRQPKNAQP